MNSKSKLKTSNAGAKAMTHRKQKPSAESLARHGLRFELARLLLQHGTGALEVARKTGLEVEQVDRLVAADASEKERAA